MHAAGTVTPIQPHAAGEPLLRIPQPPGWQRTAMRDSALIRFAMVNKSMTADNFAPMIASFPGNNSAATVPVQAADPDRRGYARDIQTVLTGFQTLPPDAG